MYKQMTKTLRSKCQLFNLLQRPTYTIYSANSPSQRSTTVSLVNTCLIFFLRVLHSNNLSEDVVQLAMGNCLPIFRFRVCVIVKFANKASPKWSERDLSLSTTAFLLVPLSAFHTALKDRFICD